MSEPTSFALKQPRPREPDLLEPNCLHEPNGLHEPNRPLFPNSRGLNSPNEPRTSLTPANPSTFDRESEFISIGRGIGHKWLDRASKHVEVVS